MADSVPEEKKTEATNNPYLELTLTISRIPGIPGQLSSVSAFKRRCNLSWIVPREGEYDPFVENEGLYPSIVVPAYNLGEKLTVIYKAELISAGPPVEKDFGMEYMGFDQEVRERFMIPEKSRTYYSESKWMTDNSPAGIYPTLILPDNLVGKQVILIRT